MEEHARAVQAVSEKVHYFFKKGEKFRIYHGSTNSTRTLNFERDKIVDTSTLNRVLQVDTERCRVLVEPNVSMGQLAEETLKHGMIPPVVMEFPGITVGGGFSGTSAESSSFKHGLFEQTARSIEIVLANGEVVTASEAERQDLFYGAAGAFGTLGVLTLLELDLIEAKQYVELHLTRTSSVVETVRLIGDAVEQKPAKHDFVDGIIFSANKGIVMTGKLTDNPSTTNNKIQRYSRARDEWFYISAERLIQSGESSAFQVIPLRDYLFRWDRGAFWGAKWAFQYFWFPFNRFTRWMLDSFLHTKTMYHALHKSGLAEQYIVQDCVFPVSTVQDFIEYCITRFEIYPLWLCPLAKAPSFSKHPHASAIKDNDPVRRKNWLLNVGIWGPGPRDYEEFVRVNREIEHKVHDLGGVKTLYAHSYYTEDEFYEVYDKEQYETLRQKYHATSLPTIFEKVRVDLNRKRRVFDSLKRIRPLGGIYGVLCTMFGGDYVFQRQHPELVYFGLISALVAILATIVAKFR